MTERAACQLDEDTLHHDHADASGACEARARPGEAVVERRPRERAAIYISHGVRQSTTAPDRVWIGDPTRDFVVVPPHPASLAPTSGASSGSGLILDWPAPNRCGRAGSGFALDWFWIGLLHARGMEACQ